MNDDFPDINIEFTKKIIETPDRKLQASFSLDAMADIQALHGDIGDKMRKELEQTAFDKEMSDKLNALGFTDDQDTA